MANPARHDTIGATPQSAGNVMQAVPHGRPSTAQNTSTAQHDTAGSTRHNVNSMEQHCMAFATQVIPICTFHQLNPTCTAAKMIAPFSRLMTEVPNTTGETGKEEASGFFPLRCHEILEGHKTNWGMTKVLFSTNEVSADPHVWIQLVSLDFWNFFSCHVKSSSPSPLFSLHQGVQF